MTVDSVVYAKEMKNGTAKAMNGGERREAFNDTPQ